MFKIIKMIINNATSHIIELILIFLTHYCSLHFFCTLRQPSFGIFYRYYVNLLLSKPTLSQFGHYILEKVAIPMSSKVSLQKSRKSYQLNNLLQAISVTEIFCTILCFV